MNTAADQELQRRRTHPQVLAAPFLEIDLTTELDQLLHEPAWQMGQNAKTLAKYRDLRVVLTVLKAERHLPGDHTTCRLSIQTLKGHLQMKVRGRTLDLPTGKLVTLDKGVVYEILALEDSAFLMTLAWTDVH
jgi:hypothetical protein